MIKTSADGLVTFNPENHTYWKGDKQLFGVTSLIDKYKEPFDKMTRAFAKAKKTGEDPYELMAKWEQKGHDARITGSAAHKVLEGYCETGAITFMPNPPMKIVSAVKFIIDYLKPGRLKPVCWECLVYRNNTASMIDLVAANSKAEIFILDYKTSKEISKDGWGRMMKYPFDQYPDSTFYHYSIQCSIYRKMYNGDIKDAYIVHLTDNGYDLIKAENIFIPDEIL